MELARDLQSLYSWRLVELLIRERDRGRLLCRHQASSDRDGCE
ncbi:hypothetical protein [Paraburkholderia sp. JHI869]